MKLLTHTESQSHDLNTVWSWCQVRVRQLIIVVLCFGLTACGGNTRIQGKQADTTVVFFSNEIKNNDELYHGLNTKLLNLKETDEPSVMAACHAPKDPDWKMTSAVGIPLLIFAAKLAIDYLVDQVTNAVKEHLDAYTQNFQGSASVRKFYIRNSSTPIVKYPCFRMTRWLDKTASKAAMDVVFKMTVVNNTALQLKPLRLYYAQSHAEMSGDGLGVAIGLKLDNVWREGNRGMKAEGFVNQVVLTEKVVFPPEEPFYRSYLGKPLPRGKGNIILPLPAWSVYSDERNNSASKKTIERNHLTASVTVAEVGDPPFLLRHAGKLLLDNKKDLSSLLKDAAKKGLDDLK